MKLRNVPLGLAPALLVAALSPAAQAGVQPVDSAHFAGPVAHLAGHSPAAARARSARQQTVRKCTTRTVRRSGRRVRRTTCRSVPVHKTVKASPKRLHPVDTGAVTSSASAAAAAQASTIATVLSTPCQNTQLIPEASNLSLVRASVLCLVNLERAQHGREPLQSSPQLEAAAESHGREMIAQDYFAHIAPSGETPVDRARASGYIPNSEAGYVIGENLAWGTLTLATPEAIVAAWIASPEHLANILEGKYRETGIDVEPEVPEELASGVEGGLYTQEFGVIVH